MDDKSCVLAIDQGTTSSRAIVFDYLGNPVATSQQAFSQIYPESGWVEHNPEDIWSSTLNTAKQAFAAAKSKGYRVISIGVTNQRETSIVWERSSGKAIYNAIVWQDRRTASFCSQLKADAVEVEINRRTGLLVDPYFSASKVAWILDHVDGARNRANKGELCFGTIDSFLINRLTSGEQHVTDATNASRTNLYNIHSGQWDKDLLDIFNVPLAILPDVLNSMDDFAWTDKAIFGRRLPIYGVAGDQQAAGIGQCCFNPGDIKSTYGTGCFVLVNTGSAAVPSKHRLLTTVAYQIDGKTTYATEGSIFSAGSSIQWLRDGLGIINDAGDSQAMAARTKSNDGVYLVPAFTGLGAPWWEPDARGAIYGLTRATNPDLLVRAAIEAVCYQTSDLLEAVRSDGVIANSVRVDGGMVANDWFLQFLTNTLGIQVQRPTTLETTALGVAYLSGIRAGLFESFGQLSGQWRCGAQFQPSMTSAERDRLLAEWHNAVKQTIGN